jgi:hypothetical protein
LRSETRTAAKSFTSDTGDLQVNDTANANSRSKGEAHDRQGRADVVASAQDSIASANLSLTVAEQSSATTAANNSISIAQVSGLGNAESSATDRRPGRIDACLRPGQRQPGALQPQDSHSRTS